MNSPRIRFLGVAGLVAGLIMAAAMAVEVQSNLRLLHQLASQGDPDAQYGLGTYYVKNHADDSELDLARDWLVQAARQHHVHAMFQLGVLLASVDRLRDETQAIDWIRTAADLGLVEAKGELGMFYFEGLGNLNRDCERAVELLEEAFELGNERAESNLVWVLATCPEASHRNGSRALRIAFDLVYRQGVKTANTLDNLAAAYAESGDFLSAMVAQKEAIELADDTEVSLILKNHLESYENRQAWRDLPGEID